MILLIDDREKAPLFAAGPPPGFSGIVRARLTTGDYSILGLTHRIAIERKTAAEVYYTCGRGRARFVRELARMREMVQRSGLALIVVTGSRAAIEAAGRARAARGSPRPTASQVLGTIARVWPRDYVGVQLCDGVAETERVVAAALRMAADAEGWQS